MESTPNRELLDLFERINQVYHPQNLNKEKSTRGQDFYQSGPWEVEVRNTSYWVYLDQRTCGHIRVDPKSRTVNMNVWININNPYEK